MWLLFLLLLLLSHSARLEPSSVTSTTSRWVRRFTGRIMSSQRRLVLRSKWGTPCHSIIARRSSAWFRFYVIYTTYPQMSQWHRSGNCSSVTYQIRREGKRARVKRCMTVKNLLHLLYINWSWSRAQTGLLTLFDMGLSTRMIDAQCTCGWRLVMRSDTIGDRTELFTRALFLPVCIEAPDGDDNNNRHRCNYR